jgi:PAS domain S-box-containing protein
MATKTGSENRGKSYSYALEKRLKYANYLNFEILESLSDGFLFLDREWRYRYVSRQAANQLGVEPEELLGKCIWEAYPNLRGTSFEAHFRKAIAERSTVQFDHTGTLTGAYKRCKICPNDDGVLLFWTNITDQEKQQEKILAAEREKNEALQKTIAMKDEFLSLISHEFKTPLTVIHSAVQAMKLICRNELSDKANDFLNKIAQNSNRQLKLVDNLLDITRVNAGQLKVYKTDLDIVLLARSITESIRIYAEQKGIRLSFASTLTKKVIGMDEQKFERILLNLLSNAIKFTARGKSVSVRVSQKVVARKCMVRIQVKDQGVGIPHDKLNVIFKRFGQVDSSLSRQAEGTGIGLHLVKMFVGLLEGEIDLESTLGKGSTFTLLFPAKKVNSTPIENMIREISDSRLIQATSIEFSDVYL